jgi:Rrf2 family iron-sulfur cluster assembly transcriptional regulator
MYSQSTEYALAIMTRLAELYDGGRTRASASDIAEARELPGPFVGKILSTLSQVGLVTGTRGPGGGFTLARSPAQIRLREVYDLFEREENSNTCRFGGGVCGVGDPCPLHDKLVDIQRCLDTFLDTTFEESRRAYQEEGLRPARRGKRQKKPESYRASRARRGGA